MIGPTGAARPTAATSVCGARIAVCTASKTEDERKRIVDGAQLGGVEAPGRSPKTLGIDEAISATEILLNALETKVTRGA